MTGARLAAATLSGLALAALVVVPLAALALTAFEASGRPDLGGDRLLGAVWRSLWTGSLAALLSVAVGGALALLTERAALPGRRLMQLAMLVALVTPGYIAALAWLRAYAPGGLLELLAGVGLDALIGPFGIVAVLAVEATPICYLVVAAGLATRSDPDAERAARVAGAEPLTVLRTVTLPLLAPSLAGAAAISFVLNVTAFGTPAVLGIPAGFSTMTTQIYRDLAFSADPASFVRAIALALLLAALAAALLLLAQAVWRDRSLRTGVPAGPAAPQGARRPSVRLWLAAVAAWLFVVLAVALPLLALLLSALTRAVGLAPVPANLTLDNLVEVLDRHALSALTNSVLLSLAAVVVVLVLSGAALAATGRRAPRSMRLTTTGVALTFALPGSTLAVAILLAYGPLLRDTLAIILLAYVAKLWLLGLRPLAAGLATVSSDAVRAARAHGASAMTAARTISLPLLLPSLVAAGLIVFLFGMHEVTMSSLLYGPRSATLGVVVLNLQQLGDPNLTAALAVLIALPVIVIGLPLYSRLRGVAGAGGR